MDTYELLYDHYKETCDLSRQAQARRNKSFIGLCILEALSFLMIIRPSDVLNIFTGEIKDKLDVTLNLSSNILQTLLWVSTTYATIRYVQDVLYIERQYNYMALLEKKLSETMDVFMREGEHYQKDYPMVLNFIDLFYKMLSPILFLAINIVRIVFEWKQQNALTFALICDTILFTSLSVILWFYFFEIHSKIIDKAASILRRWLKEV